jgi:alkylation response protein AidB-like acyl-CoA dehydrogenase
VVRWHRTGWRRYWAWKSRRRGLGRPRLPKELLIEHQLIQRKLFDMLTKVETARAYARAVMLYNASNPMGLGYYSNASKVYATQVAFEIASEGVQLHGGMGLSKGMLIEKLFRDARAGLIEDGANDSLALMAAPGMISRYAY